jgi:hypothetical protein
MLVARKSSGKAQCATDPRSGDKRTTGWTCYRVKCAPLVGVTIVISPAGTPRSHLFVRRPKDDSPLSIQAANTATQPRRYKYYHHHFRTDSIMNTNDYKPGSTDDDELETKRVLIRQSLDQIAKEVGIAMRDAHLDYPVGLTVPISGKALITMVTPMDSSDDDWSLAGAIICQILSKRLGDILLCSRPLMCAMANAPMKATDITRNVLEFDTLL